MYVNEDAVRLRKERDEKGERQRQRCELAKLIMEAALAKCEELGVTVRHESGYLLRKDELDYCVPWTKNRVRAIIISKAKAERREHEETEEAEGQYRGDEP